MKKIFAWRLTRAGRPDLVPVLTPGIIYPYLDMFFYSNLFVDYNIGCKRIAKSELYLEACAKPNVTIIRSGIDQVKGRTLVDKDGNETEVDILILATGFDIQGFTGNLSSKYLLTHDGLSILITCYHCSTRKRWQIHGRGIRSWFPQDLQGKLLSPSLVLLLIMTIERVRTWLSKLFLAIGPFIRSWS